MSKCTLPSKSWGKKSPSLYEETYTLYTPRSFWLTLYAMLTANTCTNLRHAGLAVHHKVPVFAVPAVGQAVLSNERTVFRTRSTISTSGSLSDETAHRLSCSQIHLEPLLSSQWLQRGGEPARPASHQAGCARGPLEVSK